MGQKQPVGQNIVGQLGRNEDPWTCRQEPTQIQICSIQLFSLCRGAIRLIYTLRDLSGICFILDLCIKPSKSFYTKF
ncbi:hypothetical protein HanRHA438_Chr09g0405571 [Helianthus annuus]|nr:hypothetical protein HanRHA438_Chr09g0405571 [Helianthus annuus]